MCFIVRHITYITITTATIIVPQGTLSMADINKPLKQPTTAMTDEHMAIVENLEQKRFAVICGTLSSDMTITTPATFNVQTMQSPTRLIIR